MECPDCEYNLRGLPGPIVSCPECGLESDVPVLAARQWDKPWYRAPGFNALGIPAGWMFVGWIVASIILANVGLYSPLGLTVILIGILGWCVLMAFAYRAIGGFLGLGLALLIHVVLIGYLTSLIGGFVLVTVGILNAMEGQTNTASTLWGSLWFAILCGVFWGCRRAERAIAGVCIRHYLRRKPTQ